MLRKNGRRAAALLLAVLLLIGNVSTAFAEEETIRITSAEDLRDLAKRCSLDSWSRGRTVVLTADLDLNVQDFTPIPTFGGVFDGQGHTISGLYITGSGSAMGLFRTLQESAVVRDLTVSGTVSPSGSASQTGGIAGINYGSIQNCAFQGLVRGESNIGGIVGQNRESGEISGCTAGGQVLGSGAAGGIAGENEGMLMKCTNRAEVNTSSPDTPVQLPDLDMSLEQLASNESDLDGEGLLSMHSDTGGIAGVSHGVIQSCVNIGDVGYPHVGYNVGGIAGRQSGYISGCTNSGAVYGRKDVGGIVGQAEPDIAVTPGAETLEQLQRELNQLESLINGAVSSADSQGDQISNTLGILGDYTDAAKEHTNTLLDQTAAFVDGNIGEVNTLGAAVTDALDRLSPALETLSGTSDLLRNVCGYLKDAVAAMEEAGNITQDSADLAGRALDRLEGAGETLSDAVGALQRAASQLQNAVIYRDAALEREALSALAEALSSFAGAVSEASGALSSLIDAVHSGIFDLDSLHQLRAAINSIGEAARLAAESIAALARNTDFDWDSLKDGIASADRAFGSLHDAADAFAAAMGALRSAADAANGLTGPMQTVRNALLGALDEGDSISGKLGSAFAGMESVADVLRINGGVTFQTLGDTFHNASSGLYSAANGLSQELENLHADIDSARGDLAANLQAINRQTGTVANLLLDAMKELRDGPDSTGLISDSSELDIAAVRQGKITQCANSGAVAGDRNVGGVAGIMSIEFDLDPEDDIHLSYGSTFETRAVLQENINRGDITGKKDCVGGMAGRMDLGAVMRCENYGSVTSESGSYVGGIAGWSEASIRESYAKCVLSGEDDIGGIAGWATKLRDCRSIATIAGSRSRTGAVAGNADVAGGGISGNRFVDTGTAGIDGVSYAGLAEPADFETIRGEEGIPTEFVSFTLKLLAEGEIEAIIPFQYGQDLSQIPLPDVPEQEGTYGRWPEFDTSGLLSDITLEAIYTPWAALVASAETDNGPSLALAEGQFTQDAVLQVRQGSETPPAGAAEDMVWELSLTGTDLPADAQVPIRLLDRSGSGTVWQYTDGRWQKAASAVNGQYLLLTMDGLSGVYCVVPGAESSGMLIILLPAAACILALLLLAKAVKARRKKKPAAQKEAAGKK